ncbi:hypothetical protein [Acidocella aminolytica]|uniref:Uncharacterized protein n=1 Tax=Acidocella aminolytica 101 = DSM 11237 TaxID=1120923 RepID=A0A0D6PEP6_9PROT|nr:hypothetical protein [Acidocella aminolytica]GAN79831.1 hypothetical protein Aam_030_064 [Acidocella aminolytica 101 = DSM 11237]GBQ31979.1 hypothetical protein AA11237_0030 [Acidocella aminolytica 101 = DSM 11237]SHF36071.1 hypothetical protein SAMN02746095_02970 [Acidocella aminolytica 101 = DSM 11237]
MTKDKEKTFTVDDLTAERIAVLVELAENARIGKKMLHWLVVLGTIGGSIAFFANNVMSFLKAMRPGGIH